MGGARDKTILRSTSTYKKLALEGSWKVHKLPPKATAMDRKAKWQMLSQSEQLRRPGRPKELSQTDAGERRRTKRTWTSAMR